MTFETNGGSSVTSQSVNYQEKATEPTAPTRTGYTFAGWYKEAALTTAWDFTTDVVTGDTTIYAKWEKKEYTVTFNVDGGSAVTAQTVKYEEKATKPADPTKTGYLFDGWYKESTYATAWDFSADVVTEDTTIYAKWNINSYTVTFETNGGSSVEVQNIVYQEKATEPTAPTRTGYDFAGWYRDSALTGAWNFATDTVTAATTLYAKWEKKEYTVTFNVDGGSAVTAQTVKYEEKATKPADPTKTGHTFDGWYKEETLATAWDFDADKVTGNTTIYAKWKVNKYTVTFDAGTGASTVDPASVEYNKTVTKPTDPTRTGYTFGGWYKEETLATAWDFAADKVTAATTLYAKWNIIRCTVTLNANGGTFTGAGTTSTLTVDYGTKATAPAAADCPTQTGYVVDGWYTDAACTEAYDFDSLVKNDITIYAKWAVQTFRVTFYDGATKLDEVTVNYDRPVTPPADPTKTDYHFAGWYEEEECTTKYDLQTGVKKDLDLYAGWEKQVGEFYIIGGTEGTDYIYDDNDCVLRILSAEPLTIRNVYDSTSNKIAVDAGISANITLAGVKIYSYYDVPLSVESAAGGSVKITLAAGTMNSLGSEAEYGLQDTGSGTLIIGGEGRLDVVGDEYGYGSGVGIKVAGVQINGGIVNAKSRNLGIDAADIRISKGVLSVEDENQSSYNITKAPASGSGVIVFENGVGRVYGDLTLEQDLEITGNQVLIIPAGSTLTVPSGKTLTNNGGIAVETGGTLDGTIVDNGTMLQNGVLSYGSFYDPNTYERTSQKAGEIAKTYKDSITAVEIKAGTKYICESAFEGCTNLTGSELPDSVTEIEESAFKDCTGLTSITIPSNVEYIYSSTFEGCTSLTSVDMPGVTNIYSFAFKGCTSLANITIPSDMEEIYESAFEGCTSLTSVDMPNVTTVSSSAFKGCTGLTGVDMPKVKTISSSAFKGCTGLISVDMPNVTKIEESAFEGCEELTSVSSLVKVTSLGNYAFKGCDKLASVYAPKTDSTVGTESFPETTDLYCSSSSTPSWESKYPNNKFFKKQSNSNIYWNLTTEGVLTIAGEGSTVDYPSSSYKYEWLADAYRTNITSVVIREGVTGIGNYAFNGCSNMTSITFPDGLTSIGNLAFSNCSSLAEVTIPGTVTSIGISSFADCSKLTTVTFQEGITSIPYRMFYQNNTDLQTVRIPKSVTSIGTEAFYNCTGLTDVIMEDGSSLETIGDRAFNICMNLQNFTLPDSVTTIGSSAFSLCEKLELTSIPTSVTSIGGSAFSECKAITELTVPDTVTTMGSGAFGYCRGLKKLTIGCPNISSRAFICCYALEELTILDTVETIGSEAFAKHNGDIRGDHISTATSETFNLGNGVKTIGDKAFYRWNNIENLTIPASVTSIGMQAFGTSDSSQLTTLTIAAEGESLTIGTSAFYAGNNNYKMEALVIPDRVISIGNQAFFNMFKLKTVTVGSGVSVIGNDTFIGDGQGPDVIIWRRDDGNGNITEETFTKDGTTNSSDFATTKFKQAFRDAGFTVSS